MVNEMSENGNSPFRQNGFAWQANGGEAVKRRTCEERGKDSNRFDLRHSRYQFQCNLDMMNEC